MKEPTDQPFPPQLLSRLRQPVPKRALSLSDSLTVAQHQAIRLRELLEITAPAMPLGFVSELPNVTLKVVPAHELGEATSGLTSRENGQYVILVNKNRPRVHRRWTLAHELKHVIDFPYARIWHAGLGYGDQESERYRIERIADHFAAHLLMPTNLVKRAWVQGLQEPAVLSEIFEVSRDAVRIRLDNLGLTGDDELPTATYFRRANVQPSHLIPSA